MLEKNATTVEIFGREYKIRGVADEEYIFKVAGYVEDLAIKSAAAGIDVLCFYDDVGMQTGLQISPETWRRFIKPLWRGILDKVRASYPDTLFFLHSCGNIGDIVQDIVEIGFHILHPLQPECMEFSQARGRYGNRILLCGTISAQRLFSSSW